MSITRQRGARFVSVARKRRGVSAHADRCWLPVQGAPVLAAPADSPKVCIAADYTPLRLPYSLHYALKSFAYIPASFCHRELNEMVTVCPYLHLLHYPY